MSQAAPIQEKHNVKLSPEFISPFLGATKTVLSTMAHISPAAQAPKLWKTPQPIGDVASVISMSCEQITGQLTVSFQNEALIAIASKLMMEHFTEMDDVVVDSAGEITNMITGGAKKTLGERGYEFGLATPQTYLTANYHRLSLLGMPRIVVPYQVENSLFYIDLGFVEA